MQNINRMGRLQVKILHDSFHISTPADKGHFCMCSFKYKSAAAAHASLRKRSLNGREEQPMAAAQHMQLSIWKLTWM